MGTLSKKAERTETLRDLVKNLVYEVNSKNNTHKIKFHGTQKIRGNMAVRKYDGNGRLWIQPAPYNHYDISPSGESLTKEMEGFMCALCGKKNDGYKQTKPEPHQPFWRVNNFQTVEKAVYHYANTLN